MYTRKKSPFKRNDEIDLTSLIDVVFLILIFFMVTSTFVKEKNVFKVELTKIKGATKQKIVKDALTIVITKDGLFGINEEKEKLYNKKELFDILKVEGKDQDFAVIKGDKNAPFDSFVYLESVLNELKIFKRSILVKPKEK